MAEPKSTGWKAVREYLKANPRASDAELHTVAEQHGVELTIFGPSDANPEEPGFDKFFTTVEHTPEELENLECRDEQER